MKKIFALILALAMVFSLAACGTSSAPAEESADSTQATDKREELKEAQSQGEKIDVSDVDKSSEAAESSEDYTAGVVDTAGLDGSGIKIAFNVGVAASPWCLAVRNGAQAACDKYGAEMTVFEAKSQDINDEIAVIENVVNGDFDAFICLPADGIAEVPYVQQMIDQGKPVIGINGYTENLSGWFELDQYEYGCQLGKAAADWINENLDGVANVVLMSEDKLELSILRGNGMEDTIKELCPNSTIITRAACFSTEDGYDTAETLLTQRDDINVFLCCNDTIALGVYQALVNGGYSGREDVALFGGDFTDEAIEIIKTGDVFRGSVDIMPYWSGFGAIELALYQVQNGLPEKQIIVPGEFDFTPQEEVMAKYN